MAEKTLKDIDGKILEGKIIGNDAEYPIKIKLETDKKYLEKMKKLYDVFCLNNIKWKTYNIPYLRKIFKVLAVEYDTEIIEKPGNTVYHPNAAFLPGGAFNPYFRSFLSLFFASQTRRRNPVQHCHHND